MSMLNGMPKIIRLDNCQTFHLWKWLEAKKTNLLEERPSYESVALQAGKDLGFPISKCSVRRAAKSAGMKWVEKRSGASPQAGKQKKNRRLLAELAGEVCRMADSLGWTVDPKIKEIAGSEIL